MRAWEEFLAAEEKRLGPAVVKKWLRPLRVVRFDAFNLYLEAPDSFKSLWFEEHMRPHVKARLLGNHNKPIRVHLGIANTGVAPEKKSEAPKRPPPAFKLSFDALDPDMRFDTFVTAQGNLLAHKLLSEQSLDFNPIYLFGRPGTGKTHLLMATAHQLKEQKKRVIYVRADTFTEHVVGAIRGGEMQAFRRAYRHIDALLIDDIEIFGRKGATQEELFHTFNTLHTDRKQILLAASSPPGELKHLEPRLVSRFEWGIVIPLQMLSAEQMRTVLSRRAKAMNFPLSEEVSSFLIETFHLNTKTLIRALEALVLRTHLNQERAAHAPLTLERTKQVLMDLIEEEERAILTPHKIIRTVAEHYGIKTEDILGKSQSRECSMPRQIAMHLCREQLKLPYMKIGDLFDRDHSTVMSSVRQIKKQLDEKNAGVLTPHNAIVKRLTR